MINYFNNAGSGIMSKATFSTITNHLQREMEIGAYRAATEKANELSNFYKLSAQLLNAASTSEIAFVDSASRGWNLAIYGLSLSPSDSIVTLSSEYGTNLLTIYDISKRIGCAVRVISCDEYGNFDLCDVEKALNEGGTIIAISHVAAQGSIVNPVEEIGKLAKKYGAKYIVDGCQAVGQMKVDVQRIGCDAYVTAGRKWLRGPRGTGILYVKSDSSIHSPQIDLASSDLIFDERNCVSGVKVRDDAKQFELWERNIASVLGLTNAISEFIQIGENNISSAVTTNANIIRNHIASNSHLHLVGEKDSLSGIASFYLTDSSQETIKKSVFEENNIILSIICDWDCPLFFPKCASSIFRISPHYYTDKDSINNVCRIIDLL